METGGGHEVLAPVKKLLTMDSSWRMERENTVPGKWTMLQWKATGPSVHGRHKLVLIVLNAFLKLKIKRAQSRVVEKRVSLRGKRMNIIKHIVLTALYVDDTG